MGNPWPLMNDRLAQGFFQLVLVGSLEASCNVLAIFEELQEWRHRHVRTVTVDLALVKALES
jgi:hypothetical protein